MLGIISSRENIKGSFAADILRRVNEMSSDIETEDKRLNREFLSANEGNITIEWN